MHPRAFIRTSLDLAMPRDATALLLVSMLALIGFLATLGCLAFVMLGDDLRAWNRSLDDSVTLQIPAETSAARIEMSLALLRQTPGIAELRLLDQAETARLLEPWLGPAAAPDTLPIPRLLDIRTESGAAIDIADLRQKLAAITPGAQLEDHRPALALHRRAATRLAILIALGIAGVAVFAVVLTVVATNLRLALHRGAAPGPCRRRDRRRGGASDARRDRPSDAARRLDQCRRLAALGRRTRRHRSGRFWCDERGAARRAAPVGPHALSAA